MARLRRCDTRDQAGSGNDSVIGAENGGPQPAYVFRAVSLGVCALVV
jgi:hypothetical protein